MILFILGTKAELIKCMPVMLELQKRKQEYWFVHTGQHPLEELCEKFGIKRPDFVLSKEPEISTKFWSKVNRNSLIWFLETIFKVKKIINQLKPDYVIYHGDTMSSASASIGSSKLLNWFKSWKNIHLEAGLRSGSIKEPFPEEISRIICDYFSDILFAVSKRSKDNLKNSNGIVLNVGNTIVDASLIAYEKSSKVKVKGNYALVNIHRHENINSKERLTKIVEIIKSINIPILWPIHENTKLFLMKYNLFESLESKKNLLLVSLTDYFEFINLISNSKFILTDGGSIQEESLVFKKPCIILRERTERQEGLGTGINFLTGLDVQKTKKLIRRLEKGIKIRGFKNPYGERGVSERILDTLRVLEEDWSGVYKNG